MDLPDNLQIEFRNDLEAIEREKHMPYITSVERLAMEEGFIKGQQDGIEKGIEKGVLAGKIQVLQQLLGETEISVESLDTQAPTDQQLLLDGLQRRIRQRESGQSG